MAKNKEIAVIDCAVESPVIDCFNDLVRTHCLNATYHQPAIFDPRTLSTIPNCDGIFLLGSASSVYDATPWKKSLIQSLKEAFRNKVPTLGICYGHQLIAHIFGAEVGFIFEDKKKLKGSRSIELATDFGNISKSSRLELVISHREEVKNIPEDFERLAHSDEIAVEALKHKELPIYSFQAHPEASFYFMESNVGLTDKEKQMQLKENGNYIIEEFLKLTGLKTP